MTNIQKAQELIEGGLVWKDVFKFFNNLEKQHISTLSIIALFIQLGVSSDKIWDLYEEWQVDILEYHHNRRTWSTE